MKQKSVATTRFEIVTKRTRNREFLGEMNLVAPWAELFALITPYAPSSKAGRSLFAISTMLRIHFLQPWSGLSEPAMRKALYDTPLYRQFTSLVPASPACLTNPPFCGFATCLKRKT